MFKHILMPTDGSHHSQGAIKRGFELARLCGAKVTGIHVVPDYSMTITDDSSLDPALTGRMDGEARDRATSFLDFVRKTAAAEGVVCDTVIATAAHPFDAIINTANERNCDLIVMTARYRTGLVSLIMGSEATRVLHRASIPVLVFRAVMSADHPDKTRPAP
jgi:nucleotide-binding universal stress UspA family protein